MSFSFDVKRVGVAAFGCVSSMVLAACTDAPSQGSAECTSDAQCECGQSCELGDCVGPVVACEDDREGPPPPPSIGAPVELLALDPGGPDCWLTTLSRSAIELGETSWLIVGEHAWCTTRVDRILALSSSDRVAWQPELAASLDYTSDPVTFGPWSHGLPNWISAVAVDGSLHALFEARLGPAEFPNARLYALSHDVGGWSEVEEVADGAPIQEAQGNTEPEGVGFNQGNLAFDPVRGRLVWLAFDGAWETALMNVLSAEAEPGGSFGPIEVVQTLEAMVDRGAVAGVDQDFAEAGGIQAWIDKPGCAVAFRTTEAGGWSEIRSRPLGFSYCQDDAAGNFGFYGAPQVAMTRSGPQILSFVGDHSLANNQVSWLKELADDVEQVALKAPLTRFNRIFVTPQGALGVVRVDEVTRKIELWFPESDEVVVLRTSSRPVVQLDLQRHQPRFLAWVEATQHGNFLYAAPLDLSDR